MFSSFFQGNLLFSSSPDIQAQLKATLPFIADSLRVLFATLVVTAQASHWSSFDNTSRLSSDSLEHL